MAEENYIGLEEKREQLFKDMKKEFSNGSLMAAAIPVSCTKYTHTHIHTHTHGFLMAAAIPVSYTTHTHIGTHAYTYARTHTRHSRSSNEVLI